MANEENLDALLGLMDEETETPSVSPADGKEEGPGEAVKPAEETVAVRQYRELQETTTRAQQELSEIKGQLKAWGVTVSEGRLGLDPAYQQTVAQAPTRTQEPEPQKPAAEAEAEEYFVLKSDLDRAVASAVEQALSQNLARTEQRIVGTQTSVARQHLASHKESLRASNPYFGKYEAEVDQWFEQEVSQSPQAAERFRQDPVGTYEIYRHLVLGRKVDEGAARRQTQPPSAPFTETGGMPPAPGQGGGAQSLDITRDEQALLGHIIRRAAGEDNDFRGRLVKASGLK